MGLRCWERDEKKKVKSNYVAKDTMTPALALIADLLNVALKFVLSWNFLILISYLETAKENSYYVLIHGKEAFLSFSSDLASIQ